MIQIQGLQKTFGTRPAVKSLDLQVRRGEIFGLLGHNGAGKSTTIGMLLGQVWPDAGTLRIGGHDVFTHRALALSRVGAIFEAPIFYEYLSGWRNLQILAGYSAPTSVARLREVVEWVGLTGREQSVVRTYSHGMRARLALAQALLPNPELLILDEPTNGLDPEGIHEMRHTIQRLHRELGLTILLSSHLLVEVEQLCSRIAVMNRGEKVFDGTVDEARAGTTWVRLVTDRFGDAAALLQRAGLISAHAAEDRLEVAPGRTTAAVVQCLVEAGHPVHELTPERRTLESFYLSLVRSRSQQPRDSAAPPT